MLDLVEEAVALGAGRELVVARPRDSEALLDEHAFEDDEFLPYWAELWPSGVALAREIAPRGVRGARVVQLGCGRCAGRAWATSAAVSGCRASPRRGPAAASSPPTGRRRRSTCCARTPR